MVICIKQHVSNIFCNLYKKALLIKSVDLLKRSRDVQTCHIMNTGQTSENLFICFTGKNCQILKIFCPGRQSQ